MYKPPKRGVGSRKQAASKVDEFATRLAHWAEVEMGQSRNQLPSKDELKMLLGAGAGSSMWQYILTHINTPTTVQLVRKNIQLQSVDVMGKRSHLLTERAELSRELTSLRLAVTQLESDLSRLNSDIASVDDVKTVTGEEVKELSRKNCLLSAHSLKCQDMVNVLNEFSKRIRHRVQVLSHDKSKEKSYFAKAGDCKAGSLQLESACKHDLSRTCDNVQTLLVQLAREGGGVTAEQSGLKKEQIWSKLESLLSGYSPAELMQCLCEVTLEASEVIHTATINVDLNRDAKLLRYQYDHDEGLKDDTTKIDLLKSVEDHLMALQVSHIHRSVECEQYLASAADARDRLSRLKAQVDNHFSTIFQTESEGANIARAVFQLELEVSGCEGALSDLTQVCSQLSSIREQKRLALKKLQDKKCQIDEFTQIAEDKQSQIQTLVKANSTSWSRLQKQRNELQVYIRAKVVHHESELVPLTAGLLDSVSLELQHFSHLSLARMLRDQALGRPVSDLTIHRLRNAHPTGLPHWADLVGTMGVACYSAPERVVPRIAYLVDKVAELKKGVGEKEKVLEEARASNRNKLTAQGVLLASKRCDRQHLEHGVSALQESLSVASQGLAKCSMVQHTLQEWWDQPAQMCGHWITYEGMGLEKWLEQWRVLTAKLQCLSSPSTNMAKH